MDSETVQTPSLKISEFTSSDSAICIPYFNPDNIVYATGSHLRRIDVYRTRRKSLEPWLYLHENCTKRPRLVFVSRTVGRKTPYRVVRTTWLCSVGARPFCFSTQPFWRHASETAAAGENRVTPGGHPVHARRKPAAAGPGRRPCFPSIFPFALFSAVHPSHCSQAIPATECWRASGKDARQKSMGQVKNRWCATSRNCTWTPRPEAPARSTRASGEAVPGVCARSMPGTSCSYTCGCIPATSQISAR